MELKILEKNQVGKLYSELSEDYHFFAPVKENGNISFKEISNSDDIILDFLNSKVPPKDVLFPKKEILFEYKTDGRNVTEITEREDLDDKILIFGIRSCDAHSFVLLDNFFAFGEFQDELFLKKKENTTLIGIGCNTPKSTCFCTSLKGHPFQKDDFDIFMVDLDDKFLVEGVSDKGKELIQKLSWLSDANDADVQKAQKLSQQAEDLMSTKLDFSNVAATLDPNFQHPIWAEISDICISCGTCTFLCPTCTCFDVIDENEPYGNRGRRIRIWDTCQYCLYTKETSGHNPRNSVIERCRNRILHKFSYYPKNYDLIGCVGCGRCVQLCPVNNDLRSIITKINEIQQKKKEEEKVSA